MQTPDFSVPLESASASPAVHQRAEIALSLDVLADMDLMRLEPEEYARWFGTCVNDLDPLWNFDEPSLAESLTGNELSLAREISQNAAHIKWNKVNSPPADVLILLRDLAKLMHNNGYGLLVDLPYPLRDRSTGQAFHFEGEVVRALRTNPIQLEDALGRDVTVMGERPTRSYIRVKDESRHWHTFRPEDVASVVFEKRDRITIDQNVLAITTRFNTTFRLSEDQPGFTAFLVAMARMYPALIEAFTKHRNTFVADFKTVEIYSAASSAD